MHRLKKSRISDSSKGLTLLWPLQLLERPRQTDTSCGSATRQKINDHTIKWQRLEWKIGKILPQFNPRILSYKPSWPTVR
jgi:hypothetical protein